MTSLVTQQLVTTTARPLFGLSNLRAQDLLKTELEPLMANLQTLPKLRRKLLDLDHNVKHVSGPLLNLLYREICSTETRSITGKKTLDLVRDVLNMDLPQEEVLYFLWRCLTEIECDFEILRMVCTEHKQLLLLHLDFQYRYSPNSNNSITGFPLLCIARSYLIKNYSQSNRIEECKKRLQLLIELGADINARYRDDVTLIHLAAKENISEIVKLLLEKKANIDIEIDGETARQIIMKINSDWVKNYEKQNIPQPDEKFLLFNALYNENETEFLELFKKGTAVDENDGRYTLLQLAIAKKCIKATEKLIQKGADMNLVSGNCKPPILLALDNPNYECINLFGRYTRNVNLLFSFESGTFLNYLALRCTRCENVDEHRLDFFTLIEEAIRQKIHISAKDSLGSTALEVLGFGAHNNSTLINILFNFGGFLTIDENFVLNTRPEIFTNFFDENVRFIEEYQRKQSTIPWANRSEIIEASFKFLEPLESNNNNSLNVPEMLPFHEICKSKEHQSVLLHPIVTLFLVYKWRKIAYIYIFNFMLYFLFTMSYSSYVYKLTKYSPSKNETTHDTDESINSSYQYALSISFWIIILCREIFQITISFHYYIRNFENMVEISLLLFSFLTFLPDFFHIKFISAIAITLTYIELTLLIGRHPYTGTYITMFMRVSAKSIELLIIFSSFIFAFAFGFYVFFNNINDKNLFINLWSAVLQTSAMAAGELNVESIPFQYSPVISEIMFLAFLIFVPIVFMNLLNALAVSDTQKVIDEASILCCIANIKHYTKIETMWLGYSFDNPGERCYGLITNNKNKIISYLRSYFKITVLPFPENPYTNPEPTHTLKIYLDQKNYYPHVYVWYKAPTQTSNYEIIYKPKNIFQFLEYFYYRLLLRGNEDSAINVCRLKKYPSLTTDFNECIDKFGKNLKIDLELKNEEVSNSITKNIENLKVAQVAALAVIEENMKSKIIKQNTKNMETINKYFALQEKEIKNVSVQQSKLNSEFTELKLNLQQVTNDLQKIKDLLQLLYDRQ